MATKRMLSSKIIDSDAFLDMPQTSQLLYFHLAMRVDDDGFVGNPKKIMKMLGSAENDLTILFAKKFIIGFESGVIVIKHHRMNNNWDKYNCKRTQYVDEFNQLHIKENGSYTLDKSEGVLVQSEFSLISDGKQSLEKNRIEENRINTSDKSLEKPKKEKFTKLGLAVLKAFEVVDGKNKTYYQNTTQRKACDFLISEYGLDTVLRVIEILPKTNRIQYAPQITSPHELKERWVKLEDFIKKQKNEKVKSNVIW